MKKLKLNELNLGNAEVLTREQLKKVLGGDGGSGGSGPMCNAGACSVYDSNTGTTYSGNCGYSPQGGGEFICECITPLGTYQPINGTSNCYH